MEQEKLNHQTSLSEEVKDLVLFKENQKFTDAVRPLMKYLAENCHPHVAVIVYTTRAELLEGIRTTDYIGDYLID
jgi:hypothetical protein